MMYNAPLKSMMHNAPLKLLQLREYITWCQDNYLLAAGPASEVELLERIGVDFRSGEVRGALEDVLRFGSANIPDLWLTDEEMVEKGLVES